MILFCDFKILKFQALEEIALNFKQTHRNSFS